MMKLRVNQRIIDDVLMLLMFCVSGNPAFTLTEPLGKVVHGVFLIIVLAASGFKIRQTALKHAAIWIVLTGCIFIAQYLRFGYITLLGSLNLIVKILCAILLASYLGERLPRTALRVMTGICIVALVFYAINLTGVRFHSPIKITTKGESLIIYTQTWEDPMDQSLFRNSGMFWEPGAFAGYIMAVLLLFVDRVKLLFGKYRWHFAILSLALLTTTSTTGYITYALLMVYFIFRWGITGRKKIYAFVAAAVILAGASYAFTHFEFLGEKIRDEMTATEKQKDSDVNFSRMGSLIFDMQYILSSPIYGNGLAGVTRFRYHLGTYDEEDLSGFGNGFSGCIASMGLLFMLSYLIGIGTNRTLRARWVVILLIILLLQGEYFLNYPFYLMFPFIQYGPKLPDKKRKYKLKLRWKAKTPVASPS